jgi:hypothetical protein
MADIKHEKYLFSDAEVKPWLQQFIQQANVIILAVSDEKTRELLTLPGIPEPHLLSNSINALHLIWYYMWNYQHVKNRVMLIIWVDPVFQLDPLTPNVCRHLTVSLDRIMPILAVLERTKKNRATPKSSCPIL